MISNIKAFLKAFSYAASGIHHAIIRERNFRFHLCAAITLCMLSVFYDFSKVEYCLLFICMGMVITAEMINTAIESAVDLASDGKKSSSAKAAKDCAASAVLVSAVFSAVCGLILFWDTAVFADIYKTLKENFIAAAGVLLWFAAAFAFVFAFDRKDK